MESKQPVERLPAVFGRKGVAPAVYTRASLKGGCIGTPNSMVTPGGGNITNKAR
jgi:hypothetical protein